MWVQQPAPSEAEPCSESLWSAPVAHWKLLPQRRHPVLAASGSKTVEALYDCLGVAVCVATGYRYFGENFWPQFATALPIGTALLSLSAAYGTGIRPALWQVFAYALIAAFVMLVIYWLDKRLKLTHWDKDDS